MARVTKGGLIIPQNVSGVRTVAGKCFCCGMEFYDDEMVELHRHVARCAVQHEAEIHEASPRQKLRAFADPNLWDVEYESWLKGDPMRWYREHGIDPASVLN